MEWSKIPDVLAVSCLTCAFYSISRRDRNAQNNLWLACWVLITLHFTAGIFSYLQGVRGVVGWLVEEMTLIAAGICFTCATVSSDESAECRRMAIVVFLSIFLYMVLVGVYDGPAWVFDASAIVIGTSPLAVALYFPRRSRHTLRWLTVGLQLALGAALLWLRRLSDGSPAPGVSAIFFSIYLDSCLYFWYTHRTRATGSVITTIGLMAWAMVFGVVPLLQHYLPKFPIENEVWNLPKYVVATGMLLMMLEKQIERTRHMALHDDLTGLANRRLFQDRLLSALERARRSGTSAVLMQVDLDRFKEVNDTFGHHMGDMLLRHAAEVLSGRVRRSDTVARTGGDEFSIILEEPSKREDAELVAKSLLLVLDKPIVLAGTTLLIGASIGIAVFPDDAEDFDSLCIEADLRMYQIKQQRSTTTKIGSGGAKDAPAKRALPSPPFGATDLVP